MRNLFFVFLTICISGISPLCFGTPIVVDYSVIPKTSLHKLPVANPLLHQQWPNNLVNPTEIQRKPPTPISNNGLLINNASNASSNTNVNNLDNDIGEKTSPPAMENQVAHKQVIAKQTSFIQQGFDFNAFHETNSFTEADNPQQLAQGANNQSSFSFRNILRDTVKDNEVLREFAESSIETYRSYRSDSVTVNLQASNSKGFANEGHKSSRNFLEASPLVVTQQQAAPAQGGWREPTFIDDFVQFCFSWKGLLTLCGFLIFNSILFKLV